MMLFKVLERLDRQRFTPYVISLTTFGELAQCITALGIPVFAIGMRPGLPSPSGIFRLVKILKHIKPEIVHTWMYHADLLGGLAARIAGVSGIGWCIRHSNLDKDKMKISTRAVISLCASISNWLPLRILICSEKARETHILRGYAAAKMVVIPNGFDLTRFKQDRDARCQVRAELGIADGTPLVGLIGRFDPLKNHAGFFDAAGLLHRRMPQVHFILAGKGVDTGNASLIKFISQAGVSANTHLLGLRHDMPSLMAAIDVLASSSYSEAFPNVLGEAMACGVPCAVTDVGDSAAIVGDVGGVVASGDMAGLAREIEELLLLSASNKAELSERARARVARHYEIAGVVRRYEDFFETLLASAR